MNSWKLMRYLLILTIFLASWQSAEGVRCFVCSWSPKENQTDYCSLSRFQSNMVGYVECGGGCEFVTEYNKNGNVTSYFRNCANNPVASEYLCQRTTQKTVNSLICTCNSYLCNPAASLHPIAFSWTLAIVAVISIVNRLRFSNFIFF